jgi:ketosteroid isomerase-like protein
LGEAVPQIFISRHEIKRITLLEAPMNQLHVRPVNECFRQRTRSRPLLAGLIAGALALVPAASVRAADAEDQKTVAALDTKYQKAVEQNDAATMADILTDDFTLVEGDGKRSTKADLVDDAKSGKTHYEHQEDSQRTVAVSGDTAVVTALLWAKGVEDGAKVDYKQWFTDVYVRTPKGWRYFYAQASLSLPTKSKH